MSGGTVPFDINDNMPRRSGGGGPGVTASPLVVQSVEEAWEARERAARVAAEELEACVWELRKVLSYNYLGSGCVEGEALYSKLVDVTTQLSTQANGYLSEINGLATRSVSAGNSFEGVDVEASEVF